MLIMELKKLLYVTNHLFECFIFDNHNYSHRELKLEKDIEIIDSHFQIASPTSFQQKYICSRTRWIIIW